MTEWKRIIGVDPGTVVTGYGVIDYAGSRVRHVASGVIRPGRSDPMPERLARIHRELADVISTHHPAVLAVEEAFFGNNPKTAIKLGQARGVILVLGVMNELEVVEFSPRFVKQAVVGTGGATKEQVQYMVTRILGLKQVPKPADAADALAVALCHVFRSPIAAPTEARHLTKAQQQLRDLGIL